VIAHGTELQGEMTQGDRPEWEPLLRIVGEDGAEDFMWMFEVEMSDGRSVHAYKHVDTRCYLHLDADGNAFAYVDEERYRCLPIWRLLKEHFWHQYQLDHWISYDDGADPDDRAADG
jgi:hypothetical protein